MSQTTAFLIIDVQNDFCPGGPLAVERGDEVVAQINRLSAKYENIIITQDWHPADHVSFADNQSGRSSFETIDLDYGKQVLWPAHCIQGTPGAEFHTDLDTTSAQLILRKGFRSHIDSYSAFFENDQITQTGLLGYLRDRSIDTLVLAGLATDYCVAWSALDAAKLGFHTEVILPACRAIDLDGSLDDALEKMTQAGVVLKR